jgi:hypothetical protein
MADDNAWNAAHQMELYVLLRRSVGSLPLDVVFDELNEMVLYIQHNTVDACFGCETCALRDRCRKAVIPV